MDREVGGEALDEQINGNKNDQIYIQWQHRQISKLVQLVQPQKPQPLLLVRSLLSP